VQTAFFTAHRAGRDGVERRIAGQTLVNPRIALKLNAPRPVEGAFKLFFDFG
jgi:hypothetical protein